MSNDPEFKIQDALESDVDAILNYRRKSIYRDSGYAPRGALIARANAKRLWKLTLRGQLAGFLNWSFRRDGIAHVTQLVVDEEVWRLGFGTEAMHRLIQRASTSGHHTITLKCAYGSIANAFWPEVGMSPIAIMPGRRRPLIAWTRPLSGRLNAFNATPLPPRSKWGENLRVLMKHPNLNQIREAIDEYKTHRRDS